MLIKAFTSPTVYNSKPAHHQHRDGYGVIIVHRPLSHLISSFCSPESDVEDAALVILPAPTSRYGGSDTERSLGKRQRRLLHYRVCSGESERQYNTVLSTVSRKYLFAFEMGGWLQL